MNVDNSACAESPSTERAMDDREMTTSTHDEAAVSLNTSSRGQQLQPSDRVRAVFASAIDSLKADMGADNESQNNIAISLKSKIREILRDEIVKRKQASSVLTAASALTSLCDSDKSPPPPEVRSEGTKDTPDSDANKTSKEVTDQRKVASSKSRRDSIPMSFPHKLMEILDDKANEHIITWLPHGKAFIIYQKKKFVTEVLPRFFKESKYTSFTRKLNRWGFVRVTKGPEIGAYYHKFFQRGNYLFCMQMTCQSSNKNQDEDQVPDNSPQVSAAQSPAAAAIERPMMLSQASRSPQPSPGLMGGQFVGRSFAQLPPQSQQVDRLAQQAQLLNLQRSAGANQLPNPFGQLPNLTAQLPNQVDLLSQQIQILNLQRQNGLAPNVSSPFLNNMNPMNNMNAMNNMNNSATNNMNNNAMNNMNNSGTCVPSMEKYSNAVISAAIDALQRSFEMPNCQTPSCTAQKPVLTPSTTLQQQIERYQRCGVLHPALYASIVQQQAAAAAMLRARQTQQRQQQGDNQSSPRQGGNVAKRAHAA